MNPLVDPPGDLSKLQGEFGYNFKDNDLLITALSHRSIQNMVDNHTFVSNERLEFLGDSILGMIISEFLYNSYPNYREGELTKIKGLLVSEAILFKIAMRIGLGEYIIMSKAEEKSGGRKRKTILADTYEAVLGAIYLDGGYIPTQKAVNRHILENHKEFIGDTEFINYKGRLLEYTQGHNMGVPHYEVAKEEGPEHRKTFEVVAKIRGEKLGSGSGRTKKQAEREAARAAMKKLKIL